MEEAEKLVRSALGDFAKEMSSSDVETLAKCWLKGGQASIIKSALQVRLRGRNKLSVEDGALLADPNAHISASQFQHIMRVLAGRRRGNGSIPNGAGSGSKPPSAAGYAMEGGDWLSAVETMRRGAAEMGQDAARLAIAGRAFDGLVQTKAERLIVGDQVVDDTEIPKKFWWAGGHEALKQNWTSGDFETWIDQSVHCKAYGVRFLRADIEKMLPHSIDPKNIVSAGHPSDHKEEANERWLSAREATLRIARATDQDPAAALYAIIAYAKTGHVKARALVVRQAIGDRHARRETEHRDAPVPIWFWNNCTDYDACALNWQSGVFAGRGYHNGQSVSADLTGVQFEASGIDLLDPPKPDEVYPTRTNGPARDISIFAGGISMAIEGEDDANEPGIASTSEPSDAAAPSTGPKPPAGGRRPAEWWDDLWIEMCRQLYCGEIQPTKQSDLEAAMHQWLINRDKSAAISTVRGRARKLWMAIGPEDGN